MGDEELTNWLSYNVSDWLILTVWLSKVKWHQNVQILLQALWFDRNNLSYSWQEHVFLLILRLLNELENFLEEEVGVSDRDNTKGDGCCLSHLIVLVLEKSGDGLEQAWHLWEVLVLSNFSKCESSSNFVIIWRVVTLDDAKKSVDVIAHHCIILRDDDGCDFGRWSLGERNLVDQLLNFLTSE